jgi:hypothetical protein
MIFLFFCRNNSIFIENYNKHLNTTIMKKIILMLLLLTATMSISATSTSTFEEAPQFFFIEADILSVEHCGGGSYTFTIEVRVYTESADGTKLLIAQGTTKVSQPGCSDGGDMAPPYDWVDCVVNGIPCPPAIYEDYPGLPSYIEGAILNATANY